jgi:N-acetylglucosamine-6-phosphate deacetylase
MTGPSPLYDRVADQLRERITTGTIAPNSRIPSERVLAEQFGVSRVTSARLSGSLSPQGWWKSSAEHGGSAPVSASPTIRPQMNRSRKVATGLVSFSHLASSNGLTAAALVLTNVTRPCTLDEADLLGIAPGALVMDLVRLRHLDGIPTLLDFSLVPEALAPGIGARDFSRISLYQTFAETYGLNAARADCIIEAREASEETAGHLGLASGAPVLVIVQKTFSDNGRIIQWCRSVYRGDRYRFRALLDGTQGGQRLRPLASAARTGIPSPTEARNLQYENTRKGRGHSGSVRRRRRSRRRRPHRRDRSPSTGGSYVLPGLMDLQVNGYAGVDFNAASADDFERAFIALRRDGVFWVQPTIITDDADNVVRQIAILGTMQGDTRRGAGIVGVHAEGPFLHPNHRGVHRTQYLRDPDKDIVARFLEAGPLRTITVAPELPNAVPVIRWAAEQGIIVQVGHTGASADLTRAAYDAGARACTHLFNGMAQLKHRDPGVIGATLTREDVAIQLIADDIHVSREAATIALRAAEHRIALVTDASSPAGAGDGTFTVGGFTVTVVEGVPRLPDGTLAGSTVTLLQQVGKLVGHGWAVDRAVNLASRAPARFFGMPGAGELTVGGPADFVVTDADLQLERIIVGGAEFAP